MLLSVYGTGLGNIVQSVRMPDGNIKVLVEGVERARATEVNDDDGFFVATVRTSRAELQPTPQTEQLVARVHQLFEQYSKLQQSLHLTADRLPGWEQAHRLLQVQRAQ